MVSGESWWTQNRVDGAYLYTLISSKIGAVLLKRQGWAKLASMDLVIDLVPRTKTDSWKHILIRKQNCRQIDGWCGNFWCTLLSFKQPGVFLQSSMCCGKQSDRDCARYGAANMMDGSLTPDCRKVLYGELKEMGVQRKVSWLLFHLLWTLAPNGHQGIHFPTQNTEEPSAVKSRGQKWAFYAILMTHLEAGHWGSVSHFPSF